MNSFLKKIKIWLRIKYRAIFNPSGSTDSFPTGASKILEIDYGHLKSKVSSRAIDYFGHEIPWFTYPAIEYLNQLDLTEKKMLEWGAGNSSIYFGTRVLKLSSIEHNEDWYKKVKLKNIVNHQLIHVSEADYSIAPRNLNLKFDIILIDGIQREDCSITALDLLNPEGMIILDNSDRYPGIANYFRENDLIQIDFHGFGPINDYTWTTSIFYSRQFHIKPITKQPIIPIGGGY